MKYLWIDDYCLNKKCSVNDIQMDLEANTYFLEGKMLVMIGQNKEKKNIICNNLELFYWRFSRKNIRI